MMEVESRAEVRARATYKLVGGMRMRQLPPFYRLDREFMIDQDTGHLFWRDYPDRPVGSPNASGYWMLYYEGFQWAEHRLIWKIVTRQDPNGYIDHLDGMRDNNRFENLRDVSARENRLNSVDGRWDAVVAERKAAARAARISKREARERAMLAKLKAKYEPENTA